MSAKETKVFYCISCKEDRKIKDIELKETKKGTYYLTGTCTHCSKKTSRFIGKEAAKQGGFLQFLLPIAASLIGSALAN